MKTDSEVQQNVMDELKWEPILNASEIGVAVKNGIVTLSGIVDNFPKKLAAERAARRVVGVKAVAEEIHVGVSPYYHRSDTEIAGAVVNTLKWNSLLPDDKISIKVENGVVKLEGEVYWEYQKNSATRAIENLAGIRSVFNWITVKPKVAPADIKNKITAAFQRHASLDSAKIKAEVTGSKVTLSGTVRSLAEKDDAENAVWLAPGVLAIENNLCVEEPEYAF